MKNQNQDLEHLTELLSQGNTEAFDQIYNRFWKSLFNVAYGILQDKVLCQDIVQDIFVSLWANRKHTKINKLEKYLFRSVKLKVFQQLRNGKVAKRHVDKINIISFVNETEESINFNEVKNHFSKGMEKLPPKCREVFYLSRFEQKTNKEIASELSISIKTVEGHVTYALKYFQKYFKEFITTLLIFLFSS